MTKLVCLNVPEKLLKEFDAIIEGQYSNRSVAILEAMRKLVKELKA